MLRCLVLCASVLLAVLPSPSPTGPPVLETPSGLAIALDRVPETVAAGDQLIGYVDYRAVEEARPGAAQPTSFAALAALRAANDPSARLWMAAYQGISSGSHDLLQSVMIGGPHWPDLLGLDFFDVDREVAFGAPPSDGAVMFGQFDPAAIATAFAARGYTATDQNGRTLLCGAEGCDAGTKVHIEDRDPQNPFGGNLGRAQPLAVSAAELDSSADIETVRGLLDTASGTAPSLMDDPSYRAAAEASEGDATVIQASFVPGAMVSADLASLLSQGGDDARAELARIAASFTPIPAYDLLFLADGASDAEQIVRVGLVYEDPADAQEAVDVIAERLDTLPSLVTRTPLRQVLDDRGVTSVEKSVVPSSDGTRSVALLEFRAPIASSEPDPATGLLQGSSIVYGTLVRMVLARDLLWLSPTLPTGN